MLSVIVPYFSKDFTDLYSFCNRLPLIHGNIEFVFVCDGCCFDEVFEIQKMLNYQLVKLKTNVGANLARKIGMEKSRGEWICFVDSDDLLLPEFFTNRAEIPDDHIGLSGVELWKQDKCVGSYETNFILSQNKNLAGFYQFGLWACTMPRNWAFDNLKFHSLPIFQDYYNINIVAKYGRLHLTDSVDYRYLINHTGISRMYKTEYFDAIDRVQVIAKDLGASKFVRFLLKMNLYGKLLEIGAPRDIISNKLFRILGFKLRGIAHELSKVL